MKRIKIKKGLNLPIFGEPEQKIYDEKKVKTVALLGHDYVGLKPTMHVAVGDHIKLGQVVFTDKKMPGVKYTAPGAGQVIEINRGAKRAFLSLVIELDGSDEVTFVSYSAAEIDRLDPEKVAEQLIDSGTWTAMRARPFGKVANPGIQPHSVFITAMDTNPLAPCMETILKGSDEEFAAGIRVLSRLSNKVFLCKKPDSSIPQTDTETLEICEFEGPHPAGLPGTHIHFLDPVSRNKHAWYIGAQDVVAIGHLFLTGKIKVKRVVSLAGPQVKNPRLIQTRIGASLSELTADELKEGENRVISGSVFAGRHAAQAEGYLGRFHQQVSVIAENRQREFLGWLSPGFDLYSVKDIVVSKFFPSKKYAFNTSLYGSKRAIVPIGSYEKVMPLDILPTFLLRSLAVDDVEEAEKLGCLELDEEDLALCTFVCPSKLNHGEALRRNLTQIEKEG